MSEAQQGLKELGDSTEELARRTGEEAGKSAEKWHEFGEIVKEAGEKIIEFTKESIKLYAEQQQVDAQLTMVVGELSGAFKEQAEAMEKSYGADEIKTEKMQMMLYQFGVAPDKINETVKAMLDYSARTGHDAVEATQRMISTGDTSRQAFKELGIVIEKTGDHAKDVASYVDALNGKLAGAADTEANTLAGHSKKAAAALEQLQKQFGEFIVQLEQKLGVIEKVTYAMGYWAKGFKEAAYGLSDSDRDPDQTDAERDEQLGFDVGPNSAAARERAAKAAGPEKLPSVNPNSNSAAVEAKLAEAAKKANAERAASYQKLQDELAALDDKAMARAKKMFDDDRKMQDQEDSEHLKSAETQSTDIWKVINTRDEAAKKEYEIMIEEAKKEDELRLQQEKAWEKTAETIGQSLVQNITGALESMMSGGKADAGKIVGSILSSILSMIPGIGPMLAPLGGLVGAGIDAATAPKMHSGGLVSDLPRHHSGVLSSDEHLAILQDGERVLNRQDTQAYDGGRGGGGVNVQVQTIDAESSRSYFERAGGRAIFNAVRTGRGQLRPLFGV